jgi:hypothetical protein
MSQLYEDQQPLETSPGPNPTAPTPGEESDVEVIEGPLVKKRKLIKGVEATVPLIDVAQNVANFLVGRRKQVQDQNVVPNTT